MDELRRSPTSGDLDPLRQTTSLFTFDVSDVRVTFAATSHTVLFRCVGNCPIVVFFLSFLFVFGCLLEIRNPGELPCGCICWAVLYGCMPVAKISKVVNISGSQKCSSGERMDGRIAPLEPVQSKVPQL